MTQELIKGAFYPVREVDSSGYTVGRWDGDHFQIIGWELYEKAEEFDIGPCLFTQDELDALGERAAIPSDGFLHKRGFWAHRSEHTDRPTDSLIVESPGSKTVEGRLDEPKPGLGTQRELLTMDREMVAGKDGVTPFSTFTVERRDRKTGRHVRYQHVPVVGLTDTYVTVDLTNAGLVTVLSEGT